MGLDYPPISARCTEGPLFGLLSLINFVLELLMARNSIALMIEKVDEAYD